MEKGGIIVGKGQVLGVSITAMNGEAMTLNYVHLARKRDGTHVLAQGEAEGPKALAATAGTRVPVSLVFATDRCVHRVLDRAGEADDLLRQAFPNAPLDELITSLWRQGAATGASMARRNAVLGAIEQFTAAGLRVVRVTIGPWGLLHVRALLENEDEAWRCGGHVFTFSEGRLENVKRDSEGDGPITIGDEPIGAGHALAFASAYEHLHPASERLDPAVAELRPAQQQERARYFYEVGLVVALVLFVMLIGGERVVAHRLQRSQAVLQTSADAHGQDLQAVADLRQRVAAMERSGAVLGNGRTDRLALNAAHIAASVPPDIRLERLAERPLRSPLKEKAPMDIATGVVEVQGACADAHALDLWITALKRLPGIGQVKLTGYAVDPEDGRPRFQLELAAS